MKINPETTGVQTPSPWSAYGVEGHIPELFKAVRGSGAAEGTNSYDRNYGGEPGWGAATIVGGDLSTGVANAMLPLALPRYRVMARNSTVALAEAANVLPILAAETNVVVDEDLADDETAQRGKKILELEIIARRQAIFRAGTQSLRYGWKDVENVYVRKTNAKVGKYVGLKKFKELAGDHIQLRVDDHGNLTQVLSYGKALDADYFTHFVHAKEDDNWFGLSRFENIRRDWANYLELEDLLHTLVRKGAAKAPYVGVMPEDPNRPDKDSEPNKEMGLKIAKALSNAEPVVYEKTRGIDALDMRVNADLAEKNLVSVDFVDIGNPGPAIGAIAARLDTLLKNIIRGMLLPERTLTEASTGGSRADSETHGDIVVDGAEAWHELLVDQLNDQVVAVLIRENCGEEYVNRIKLQAVALQDERRKQLSAVFTQLLTDDAFRRGLVKAMGSGGVEALVAKLGLDIKVKNFKLDEAADGTAASAKRAGGTVEKSGADDELSAAEELDQLLQLSGGFEEARHPRDDQGKFAVVDAPLFHGNGKAAEKWALEHVRGSFTNASTGRQIGVARGGIEKATSGKARKKSGSDDHFEALQVLPQLIEHAQLIESHPDRDNNPNVVAIHRFHAKLRVGDRHHDVKLTVKEHAQPEQGHKFYTHELTEIELPNG